MNTLTKIYVVVEHAGYIGERKVKTFNDYWKAIQWLNKTYDDDDKENLHPAICRIDENGDQQYEL